MNDTYLSWIESEIRKEKFGARPVSLYEPLRYIMSLGGKRLRPLLTLLAYSLYKKDVRKIVPIANAVEIFHNFTLLHDDIMDNAPLRRGKPAVHKKWNVSTAILAGDVMQIKVYDLLVRIDDAKIKDVLMAFNRCATEICEGQQWDMEFEGRDRVSEVEYIKMTRLKTAVLLGFSLELGAILAGAGLHDRKALREFGINIGVGFQLKDDLLDVFANKKKFGKVIGGDIMANKKTFLLIKAMAMAKGKERKTLMAWLEKKKFNNRNKVEAITAIYETLNLRNITEKKARHFFEKGSLSLEGIKGPNKKVLLQFAKDLMDRQT